MGQYPIRDAINEAAWALRNAGGTMSEITIDGVTYEKLRHETYVLFGLGVDPRDRKRMLVSTGCGTVWVVNADA